MSTARQISAQDRAELDRAERHARTLKEPALVRRAPGSMKAAAKVRDVAIRDRSDRDARFLILLAIAYLLNEQMELDDQEVGSHDRERHLDQPLGAGVHRAERGRQSRAASLCSMRKRCS